MSLQSQLLRGDPKLEAAAVSDPAHIKLGAAGPHVHKIQTALILLDGAAISADEVQRTFYGTSTAAMVLAYKQKRNIVNRSYQTTADNIVGKMTMASLDREMLKREAIPTVPVKIKPLSHWRVSSPLSPTVLALFHSSQPLGLNAATGSGAIGKLPPAPPPHILPVILELRQPSSGPYGIGHFEVTNGTDGNITVIKGGIALIRPDSGGPAGTFFDLKRDRELFTVIAGAQLGTTLIVASANGFSASLTVVVAPAVPPTPSRPVVFEEFNLATTKVVRPGTVKLGTNPSIVPFLKFQNAAELIFHVEPNLVRKLNARSFRCRQKYSSEEGWQMRLDVQAGQWVKIATDGDHTDNPDPGNVEASKLPAVAFLDTPGLMGVATTTQFKLPGGVQSDPNASRLFVRQNFTAWVEAEVLVSGARKFQQVSDTVDWHSNQGLSRSPISNQWAPDDNVEISLGHASGPPTK